MGKKKSQRLLHTVIRKQYTLTFDVIFGYADLTLREMISKYLAHIPRYIDVSSDNSHI